MRRKRGGEGVKKEIKGGGGKKEMGKGEMREKRRKGDGKNKEKNKRKKTKSFPLKNSNTDTRWAFFLILLGGRREKIERNEHKKKSAYNSLETKRRKDVPGAYLKQ